MRPPRTHRRVAVLAALLGGVLTLTGCSSASAPPAPAASPSAKPSPSAPPAVTFKVPAKLNGLPRSKEELQIDSAKAQEAWLKRMVFEPKGGSVAAVFTDPKRNWESLEVSAASGQVASPEQTLQLLTRNRDYDMEDVRPADIGIEGGVGTCGVSYKLASPAVVTICDWAEPGSVGRVRVFSLKDRRDLFTDVRTKLGS